MTDVPTTQAPPRRARPPRQTKLTRPDITLPDGRVLTPRDRLADELKIHPRAFVRKNTATVYVAGVAYVDRAVALMDIAGDLRRRNEPQQPRAGAGAAKRRRGVVEAAG